jgi:hypothetical protein
MLSSFFKYLREFSSSKYLWQQHSQVHFIRSRRSMPFPKGGRGLPQQLRNPSRPLRILDTDEKISFEHSHSY